MRGAADNYAAAIRDWGHERARTIWRWTEENLLALRADECPPLHHAVLYLAGIIVLGGVIAAQVRRIRVLSRHFERTP